MTFFPEPIKPSEVHSEDEIIVSPIEGDKKGKDKNEQWGLPSDKNRSAAYGAILVLINKLASLFIKDKGGVPTEDELTRDINSLKSLLNQLKELDQGENAPFCQRLSNLWHTLSTHLHEAKRAKLKTRVDLAKLKIVLTDMDYYPPNEQRKLGFYLAGYAGEEWLPFPFMEILKKLHSDYKVNKNSSILARWTDLLDQSLS